MATHLTNQRFYFPGKIGVYGRSTNAPVGAVVPLGKCRRIDSGVLLTERLQFAPAFEHNAPSSFGTLAADEFRGGHR